MSSRPPTPSAPAQPSNSQQEQSDNNSPASSSSPKSMTDSAVHVDEAQDRTDPDSSFQSNTSERHPKGKRKRTAAKDKAILEAAYNANPKPDKAARLDIVQRVSLNEKEVQIWFQNRRQNDRRKSRPLSPQEIAALQYGGMQVMPVSDAHKVAYTTNPPPPSSSLPATEEHSPASRLAVSEPASTSPPAPSHSDASEERMSEPADACETARRASLASVGLPMGPSPQTVELNASQPQQLYRSNSVGYYANRLHSGSAFQSGPRSPDSYRHEFMPASRPSSATPGPLLPPPQSSKFRLSMSVEGKAELVPQPSPPRLSPSASSDEFVPPDRPCLHRSHSVASAITLPPISALTASLEADAPPPQSYVLQQPQPRFPPRLYRSRSRDVHAWELACEANSGEHRDELTAYAARESSGSAIAAISLLRTLSSSSHSASTSHSGHVLQSNPAKRNARANAQQHQSHAKRPKLGRCSSSVGRLQTDVLNNSVNKPVPRRDTPVADIDEPKTKASALLSPGGHDSDKENWSPDDGGHVSFHGSQRPPAGRRPLPSAPLSKIMSSNAPSKARRRALEDGTNRFMLGRSNTAPVPRRKKGMMPIEIFEDCGGDADASDDEDQCRPTRDGVTDDEVEQFMRGEVSPSKKGAASAIAGLLALSQGNWR